MKLQLDLDNKVIRIEDKVNLSELYDVLKKLFPQGEWKKFSIETNTKIIWNDPINIPIYPISIYPNPCPTPCPITPYPYPWWGNPIIICDSNTANIDSNNYNIHYTLNNGVYNIEV